MPRTEEANQRIREKRREQILTAATTVFARRGLANTGIADIAELAEVSHGLLYRHFASKEEVFVAVIERALEHARQLALNVHERTGTPVEQLHWLIEKMLLGQNPGTHADYFLVILYTLTNDNVPEQALQMALQQGQLIHELVRELIIEGQRVGEIRPFDPEQLTRLLLSCVQGLVIGQAFPRRGIEMSPSPDAKTVLTLLQPPLSTE